MFKSHVRVYKTRKKFQMKSPGMTPREFINDFFNVNWNVLVHMKQRQSEEQF